MSKNNLLIIISAALILVLSVGGYLVYSNSQKTTENSSQSLAPKSMNSNNSQNQSQINNTDKSIIINETGTINSKFASEEIKEQYAVGFDPCKMLTPELTEKYPNFLKLGQPKLQTPATKGQVLCTLLDDNMKSVGITIVDNNASEKPDSKKELENFKKTLENIIFKKTQNNTLDNVRLINFSDNTFLVQKREMESLGKSSIAEFMINNYKIVISFSSKEKYDDIQFENFVKDLYQNIKA